MRTRLKSMAIAKYLSQPKSVANTPPPPQASLEAGLDGCPSEETDRTEDSPDRVEWQQRMIEPKLNWRGAVQANE
jgi:hypothetical protein